MDDPDHKIEYSEVLLKEEFQAAGLELSSKLLPIIPRSAHDPGIRTVGVLVNREHTGILDGVGKHILDMTAGRAEIVASDVDAAIRAMLIVFPDEFTNQVENLLGREDISRLRLPAELGEGSPDVVLASLQRRMAAIPKEISEVNQELARLSVKWRDNLAIWRVILQDNLESTRVLPRFGETDMTFVVAGWVPVKEIEKVETTLKREIGETVLVKRLPLTPEIDLKACCLAWTHSAPDSCSPAPSF